MFAFRYHGNYAGPGWSAGRYQSSVAKSDVPAIDEFDRTAKEHDRAYALKKNLKEADYKFYRQNIGRGLKRTVAALAVGTQGFLRKPSRSRFTSFSKNEKNMPYRSARIIGGKGTDSSPYRMKGGQTVISVGSPSRSRKVSTARAKPRMVTVGTQTMKRKRTKVRGAKGKSAGFFPKATRKQTGLDYYSKRGVTSCTEYGNSITGSALDKRQAVIVGHSTIGWEQAVHIFSMAFVQWAMKKVGYDIGRWDSLVEFGGRSITFSVVYRVNPTTGGATFSHVVGGNTPLDFVNAFSGFLNSQKANNRMELEYLQITRPAQGGVSFEKIGEYDLRKSKFQYYAKSELKVQNRTVNSTDTDDTAVDNCPLYGKSYEGTGNYFRVQETAYQCANNLTFANSFQGAYSSGDFMAEPQNIKQLTFVKKVGKVHLEPGAIKTSVLTFSKKTYAMRFINSLAWNEGATQYVGNKRFIHVEKMLQSVGTTDVNSINVHYEVDLKCGGIFSAPKLRVSAQLITVNPA